MAKLYEKIEAELENIEQILKELNKIKDLTNLSTVELAGTGAFIHNFYNGIENILKQIIISKYGKLPDGASWHSELLKTAVKKEVISSKTAKNLKDYLAFRHFFSHAYSFDLNKNLMMPLVKKTGSVYKSFLKEIKKII
jgi:uncharacterized protein YutE (UPF0331/DUF86 family)